MFGRGCALLAKCSPSPAFFLNVLGLSDTDELKYSYNYRKSAEVTAAGFRIVDEAFLKSSTI